MPAFPRALAADGVLHLEGGMLREVKQAEHKVLEIGSGRHGQTARKL